MRTSQATSPPIIRATWARATRVNVAIPPAPAPPWRAIKAGGQLARVNQLMATLTKQTTRLQPIGQRIATMQAGSWRTDKQTSAQRGYGYKWQQARAGYLAHNQLCVYCQREGRVTAATVVDHITPHRGDMALFWQRSNWQSLCRPCHDVTKAAQERADGLR